MTRSRTIRILAVLVLVALGLLLWRTDDDAVSQSAPPATTAAAESDDATPTPPTEPAAEAPAREEAAAPALVASPSEDLVECRFRSGGAFEPVSGTVRLPRDPGAEEDPPSYPMAEGVAFLPRAFVAELAAGRDPESLVLEEADGGAAPCIGVEELDPDLFALDFPREVVLEFHVTDLRGEPIEGAEVTVLGQSLLDLNANGPRTDAAGRLTARVRSPSRQLGYRVRKYGYAQARDVLTSDGRGPIAVPVSLGRVFVGAFTYSRRYPLRYQIHLDDASRAMRYGAPDSLIGQGVEGWLEAMRAKETPDTAVRLIVNAEVDEAWDSPRVTVHYAYDEGYSGNGALEVPYIPLEEASAGDEVQMVPLPDDPEPLPGRVVVLGMRAELGEDSWPREKGFWFSVLDRDHRENSPVAGEIHRLYRTGWRSGDTYVLFLPPGRYALTEPEDFYRHSMLMFDPPLLEESEPFEVTRDGTARVEARFVAGAQVVSVRVVGPDALGVPLEMDLWPYDGEDFRMAVMPGMKGPRFVKPLVPGAYRLYVYSPTEMGARAVGPILQFPQDVGPSGELLITLTRQDFQVAGVFPR